MTFQPSLFATSRARRLELCDADLRLHSRFLAADDSRSAFGELMESVPWRHDEVTVFGKRHPVPRLQQWYGDPGTGYRYSGVVLEPLPWTPRIAALRDRASAAAGARFNSVLLNLYRDGADKVGWHADDEPELGQHPTIAAISLGATRRFRLRHRHREDLDAVSIDLKDGSLLVMAGATQACWHHAVTPTKRAVGPRISLTFRVVATG